jgi:hypothetical protein
MGGIRESGRRITVESPPFLLESTPFAPPFESPSLHSRSPSSRIPPPHTPHHPPPLVPLRFMTTWSVAGMPVSREDALSMLNGATRHTITNLRDGVTVTMAQLPSCQRCRLGWHPGSEFPWDGKRCGGCRAVYYCDTVRVAYSFDLLGVE